MNKLNKSVDDIRKELFEFIESKQDDYIKKGFLPTKINLNKGILRGMLEVFIFGIWQLYNTMSKILIQAIPIHSTGDWLKLHAESVGLTPKKKTKAIGTVQFTRGNTKGNIAIAKNKIVGTLPDGLGKVYRYAVTKDVMLLAKDDVILVEVESEDFGEKVNANNGMITKLITPIVGIKSVLNIGKPLKSAVAMNVLDGETTPETDDFISNYENWLTSEGTDEESDSLLRERYVAQWQRITGVTRDAYMAAALSVDTVTAVSVDDQHPRGQGTIDIYVRSVSKMASTQLLDRVKEAIKKEVLISDNIKVMKANMVNVEIKIEIESKGVVIEDLKLSVIKNIRDYINTLKIGEDVVRDKVAATIINLEGVKKINWSCFSIPSIPLIPIIPIKPVTVIESDINIETAPPEGTVEPVDSVKESITVMQSELVNISCLEVTVKEVMEELDDSVTGIS